MTSHLQHPGGRVDALLNLGHPLNVLEVRDQVTRLPASGAVVDYTATPFEQQQLVKGLCDRLGSACRHRMVSMGQTSDIRL